MELQGKDARDKKDDPQCKAGDKKSINFAPHFPAHAFQSKKIF